MTLWNTARVGRNLITYVLWIFVVCCTSQFGLAQTYTISTFAGGGSCVKSPAGVCATGDGGPATSAYLTSPAGLALDPLGNLYVLDLNAIRKVTPGGTITAVGLSFLPQDCSYLAFCLAAKVGGMAFDSAGDLYLITSVGLYVQSANGNATKLTGSVSTTTCPLCTLGVAADNAGNVYWTASGGVLKLSSTGIISAAYQGGRAISALALDAAGNLFVADSAANLIVKVDTSGKASPVAGGQSLAGTVGGYSGDNGPATSAQLNSPSGVAVDSAGNVYIADAGNNRIRKVDTKGVITTVAGTGGIFYNGDGGLATNAGIQSPNAVAVAKNGSIYVSDVGHQVIRLLTPSSGTAPTITSGGVVPLYSSVATVQPGEWVSIYGTNLANATVSWNGDFPTSLGGTKVTFDGKPAFLWYVSPTQINAQVPDDANTGPVPVVVTTASGTSASTVTLAQFAPSFALLDSKHVTGIILRSNGSGAYGGGTYDIVGPTGNSLGFPTVAARAGDTIELFGVGFGPTNPVVVAGQPFSGAAQTTYTVSLSINNVTVNPTFAGLSSAGLYQINLTLPAGLGTGDLTLQASVGGAKTAAGVVITLQ